MHVYAPSIASSAFGGKPDTCPICTETDISPKNTISVFGCGHWLCFNCFINMGKLECCICRHKQIKLPKCFGDTIQIFINFNFNSYHTFNINIEKTSVLQLKQLFVLQTNWHYINLVDIRFIYSGKELLNDRLLNQYNLTALSTIHAICLLRGD